MAADGIRDMSSSSNNLTAELLDKVEALILAIVSSGRTFFGDLISWGVSAGSNGGVRGMLTLAMLMIFLADPNPAPTPNPLPF